MSPALPGPLATTGIGSLPHTQLELALQQALSVDIPYWPQLPRRDPAEYMIAQAVAGLPGLRCTDEGMVTVDAALWEREGAAFARALDDAIEGGDVRPYAPPAVSAAAWQPFLWEVGERKLPFAKAQLAGPCTARWAVTLADGRPVHEVPDLDRAIYRLVLARALGMVRAIRERGATPIFFFDEPGLYALDVRDARHLLQLQELKIALLALEREGALTGLHCCGNTAWGAVLQLGMRYLSLDVGLSLGAVLSTQGELGRFLARGGRLSLGIVPTNQAAEYDLDALVALVRASSLPIAECLLTPACGLALRSLPDCERIFSDLSRAQAALRGA